MLMVPLSALRVIAVFVAAGVVVATAAVLLLPKTYCAEEVIAPYGEGPPVFAELLVFLNSRTLAEDVIEHEKLLLLLDRGEHPNMENAVAEWRRRVGIEENKTVGTIRITGIFEEPQLAARVVSGCVEAVQRLISGRARSFWGRERAFLEGQLLRAKRDFLETGSAVLGFYGDGRVSDNGGYVAVPIEHSPVSLHVSAELVPGQVCFAYLLQQQDVLDVLNSTLMGGIETAGIGMPMEDLMFEVIDRAVPPTKPFGPRIGRLYFISTFFSLFFGGLFSFFWIRFGPLRTKARLLLKPCVLSPVP